ncbi:MAG: hypothetical protein ABJN42_09850 [Roseibium sp.]|uniref:hypothetical protein n=1 Tax=Roseibium sp. TaxID=1936156 RepID=UPI0032987AA2
MTKSIREAFTENGIRAEYNGYKATVLPMTAELHSEMNPAEMEKIGTEVSPGAMLVSWNEDGTRRGRAIDPFANNDLALNIARSDGSEQRIDASNPASATNAIVRMVRDDTNEREQIEKDFAEAQAAHEKAVGRGETPDEPVKGTPTYADGAFDRVGSFVETVKAGLSATVKSDFISAMEENGSLSSQAAILRNQSVELSHADQAKAAEYRSLREQIGQIQPDHELAVASAPAAYTAEGAGEAISEAMDELDVQAGSLDASAVFPDRALATEVFKVLTTTPVEKLSATPLNPADARRVIQDMARFADKDWNEGAKARLNEVFADRMPDYVDRFKTQTFSKDEADIFLVSDRAGVMMYGWDSASRVTELDVKNTVLAKLTKDDVPTDEQMDAARSALTALEHDNGEEIDFGWGDNDEDEITRGPRPEGA